jgi:hypothetical protein
MKLIQDNEIQKKNKRNNRKKKNTNTKKETITKLIENNKRNVTR